MRLRILVALVGMMLVGVSSGAMAQTPFRPVAVVNDSVITGYDLAQRVLLLRALGYPADQPEQLQTAALDQLVEDKLKLQAGEQAGITPTEETIAVGIEEYARRAGVAPDEFRALMSARGVTQQALDDLVGAQVVWLGVIRARFGDRVQPDDAEIDAQLTRGGGDTQYRVLEIGLSLTGAGRSEEETRALARELSTSLGQGADFAEAAARYSEAPSAGRGGDVGWVPSERLPPDLRQALSQLELGAVSPPIETPGGGLAILKLVDTRQAQASADTQQRSRESIRNDLVNQRSDRLAEGLLQEMRRDALIEVR